MSRPLTITSPGIAWIFVVAGILATALAWQDRHPDTTSDFTLFYVSAQQSTPQMYAHPPGPPRGNMNPPLFQLALRPLTWLPLPTAATIWRGLNVLSLVLCIWWLARASEERWNLVDYGLVLAWAPMASTIALNQLTWILWPLLMATWWCWRRGKWTPGAIAYGIVLSLKPFLGVFLLWLLVRRQWKAALVSAASAGVAFTLGVVVYGVDVTVAWIRALADVTWVYAGMNASLQGMLARVMTLPARSADPLVVRPELVPPLALIGGAVIVGIALVRTRNQSVDRSWTTLMTSALLASPLGWLYYIWWVVPGTKPSRVFMAAPLLWVPMAQTPFSLAPSGWLTLTLGSVYFWSLFALWLNGVWSAEVPRPAVDTSDESPLRLSRFALAIIVFVGIVVSGSAIEASRQSVTTDPAVGTWILDRARSSVPQDRGIDMRTIAIELAGDAIKETIVTREVGVERHVEFVGRYDGKEVAVPRAIGAGVTMKRVDPNTVESVWRDQDDAIVEKDTRTVSVDGRTMTISTTTPQAGLEEHRVEVYDRR